MRPTAARVLAAPIVLMLAATPLPLAQQRSVPVMTLTGVGAEFKEQFTMVNSVREMRDGRVVVADPCEKAVFILDFDRGTRTRVGREGDGPGEYQLPLTTLAGRGDATLILDIGSQKFISVTAAGTTVAAASPADVSSLTRELAFSFSSRVLTDSLGRIYTNGNSSSRPPGQPRKEFDSIAVTRFDPRNAVLDTVAFLENEQVGGQRSGASGASGRTGAPPVSSAPDIRFPFRASATWVVAPDGSVGIVRPEPFAVQWISPERRRAAPRPLIFQPVRVTDADKKQEMNPVAQQRGCSMRVSRNIPGGIIGSSRTTLSAPLPGGNPIYNWPEFKHPYANRENAVLATREGGIMILLERAASDSVPTYNVYSREGALLRRLQLPPGTRLMGLGRASVYVARNDTDGLQYLRRYPVPR